MRVLGPAVGLAVLLSSVAGPSPSARAVTPEPESLCTIEDPRLAELSGLAVDGDTVYAVNDGGTRLEVVVLDHCRVHDTITNPIDPYDVEDLALGPDGTLWLGDVGDNRARRDTVALHAMTSDGNAVLYRLTYPDGPRDAEAFVVDRDGVPYIITKAVFGAARVYRPAGRLRSPGPTPLERVGSVSVGPTDTPGGPVPGVGSVLVTGAALSADGRVVALRTYTDAYLFPVVEGDLVAAFEREPVRVPLPNEEQGEAIAFTADGTLLSAGEGGAPLRAVAGAAGLVTGTAREGGIPDVPRSQSARGNDEPGSAVVGNDGNEVSVLPAAVIAVAVTAMLAALSGIRVRHRRR